MRFILNMVCQYIETWRDDFLEAGFWAGITLILLIYGISQWISPV